MDVTEDAENQLDKRRWQTERCWYMPVKLGA